MPLNLRKVHEFAAVLGKSQPQVVATHHYIRVKGEGADFPLYVQGGEIFAETGPALAAEDVPEWFWDEIEKCAPESLAIVGWTTPQASRKGEK